MTSLLSALSHFPGAKTTLRLASRLPNATSALSQASKLFDNVIESVGEYPIGYIPGARTSLAVAKGVKTLLVGVLVGVSTPSSISDGIQKGQVLVPVVLHADSEHTLQQLSARPSTVPSTETGNFHQVNHVTN